MPPQDTEFTALSDPDALPRFSTALRDAGRALAEAATTLRRAADAVEVTPVGEILRALGADVGPLGDALERPDEPPRAEMLAAGPIRLRMAGDIADLSRDLAEGVVTRADLERRGWTQAQIRLHGPAAIQLAAELAGEAR